MCGNDAEWGQYGRPHGYCCWACRKAAWIDHKVGVCGGDSCHGKHCWHRRSAWACLRRRSQHDAYIADNTIVNKVKRCVAVLLGKCVDDENSRDENISEEGSETEDSP